MDWMVEALVEDERAAAVAAPERIVRPPRAPERDRAEPEEDQAGEQGQETGVVVTRGADFLRVVRRFGAGELSTAISLRAKVWVPQREPNAVAVEVIAFHAGALPLAVKALQDGLAERLRAQNIRVLWFRRHGRPVAVLRFQSDRREAAIRFQRLEVKAGSLILRGQTLDPELRQPPPAPPAGGG